MQTRGSVKTTANVAKGQADGTIKNQSRLALTRFNLQRPGRGSGDIAPRQVGKLSAAQRAIYTRRGSCDTTATWSRQQPAYVEFGCCASLRVTCTT
jgi:hypothetical protein